MKNYDKGGTEDEEEACASLQFTSLNVGTIAFQAGESKSKTLSSF